MKKVARSPSRWFAAWRARSLPAAGFDAADFGTAFGLDLSIPDGDPPPRPAATAPGWRARWALRRRSS